MRALRGLGACVARAGLFVAISACSAVSDLDRFGVGQDQDAALTPVESTDGGTDAGATSDAGADTGADAGVIVGGEDLLVVLRDAREFEDDYIEVRVLDADGDRHCVVALLPPQIFGASDDISVLLPGALRDVETPFVDVYADTGVGAGSPDGRYTAPAAGVTGDPAWREPVVDGRADIEPRTAFDALVEPVVSGGPFSLTITGLPDYHRDVLFEVRVRDVSATPRRTVGHLRLGRTPPGDSATDFMASIAGVIEPDVEYEVEFYFDNDADDAYDPPTTDHAWRLSGRGTSSGLAIDFEHGGAFTDVGF